jgi:hypothetical protein
MQKNMRIDADFYMSCGECLNEIEEMGNTVSPSDYAQFQVGIELETNSLIVDCKRHESTLKMFRLHDDERDYNQPSCDCCDNE